MTIRREKNSLASQMTMMDHFLEFRRRFLWCMVFFVLVFGVSYLYADVIYRFLVAPLWDVMAQKGESRRMIYTALTEVFFSYMKVSFWFAFCLTCPMILFQIWRFVAPGLYRNEKVLFFVSIVTTPVLFLAGMSLAYYVVMPLAWSFFLGFEQAMQPGGLPIEFEAKVGEYLSLVMSLMLGFGVSFQLPILLMLLSKVAGIDVKKMKKFRKYFFVLAFLLAALFTPPDVVSQIILACPLIFLYEFSIVMIGFLGSSSFSNDEKQEGEGSDEKNQNHQQDQSHVVIADEDDFHFNSSP